MYPPTLQQPFGSQNQQNAIKPPPPPLMNHPSQMSQMPNPLQSNHMNQTTMLSQTMNNANSLAAHHQQHGMPLQSGPPMYDMLPNPTMNGLQKGPSEFIYLNQQHPPPPHHLSQLTAQNQYMPSRNTVSHMV
jgi:hypothetical protein